MTREDAKKIMANLAVISHYAAGGDIEFPLFCHDGSFVKWWPSRSMNIPCLGQYRITGEQMKIHVKHNPYQLRECEAQQATKKTRESSA